MTISEAVARSVGDQRGPELGVVIERERFVLSVLGHAGAASGVQLGDALVWVDSLSDLGEVPYLATTASD